jgi:septum site-determining protein MinC
MAKDIRSSIRAKRSVTLLRGRLDGLELTLVERDLGELYEELGARLAERPSFFRGTSAVANFGAGQPSPEELARLRGLLAEAGVTLRALAGSGAGLEVLARNEGLAFESTEPKLSEAARSLVADFAGARKEIAARRKRGESSVRRAKIEPSGAQPAPELRLVDAGPSTLYQAATLRGGQTLHQTGNIVIVGDVNPGAELVATGDIVVFGRLAGIAHAGAQGDDRARIYALDLAATQLRIATYIAADHAPKRGRTPVAEVAFARDGQIEILPFADVGRVETSGASLA